MTARDRFRKSLIGRIRKNKILNNYYTRQQVKKGFELWRKNYSGLIITN